MLPSILSLMLKSSPEVTMTTLAHDPDPTSLPPGEHPLAPHLETLALACEGLQTWASDLASALGRQPRQGGDQITAARLDGEQLLAAVLRAAAPALGQLASGGGR